MAANPNHQMAVLPTLPDHLLALAAAFLDVPSFGSFACACRASASCCRMKDLDLGILVRHVDGLRGEKLAPKASLYEGMELFRVVEGEGIGGKPGEKRSRVQALKMAAMEMLLAGWMDEAWPHADTLVREMFENAVMVNNLHAVDFLLSAQHPPKPGEVLGDGRDEAKSEDDGDEDDGLDGGRFLHVQEEEEEEGGAATEEERVAAARARFCLRESDVELGLLHAAEKLNGDLVWLLLRHGSASLLISAQGLTNAMVLAVTAGSMELTGCILAHLFLRDIPRKQKNDAVAKAMHKAAEFGFARLTVDLTNMLQFRAKLWQFRLAEERAERMRQQEKRVQELEAEVNSRYFRRRRENQRSAEAIAREQAEIEARAVRDEREAVFGVKDFRQALEVVLNTATAQKQIGVLEAIFASRISDEIAENARRRLFKMAVRKNDPDAGNSYIEVAKFFIRSKIVSHRAMIDLLVESVRRDAIYSVMALLEVNSDPEIQAFSPALIKSTLDMCNSEEMVGLLRSAFT